LELIVLETIRCKLEGGFFKFSFFFWVEKWNPPTRSKTAEIGQKNRRNLRRKIGTNPIFTILDIEKVN
jgi:hypothetical protein